MFDLQAINTVPSGVVIADAAMQWYALYTRPRFEKTVEAELRRKQFETYLPALNEVHQWKDRKKIVRQPVFPGYVFARFLTDSSSVLRIRQTPGVVCILGDSDRMIPVPDRELEDVRRLVETGISRACPFIREGARVRVRRGPLKGVTGLLVRFKSETRLVVSIDLLSRSVFVEIDAADVQALRP